MRRRRMAETLVVISSTLTLAVATAQPASASNYSTDGCAGLIVEYVSAMGENSRFVDYVLIKNNCDPFYGTFFTEGVLSEFTYGPVPLRVEVDRRVDIGKYICGVLEDSEQVRGVPCTEVA